MDSVNLVKDKIRLRALHTYDQQKLAELANNRNIYNNLRDFFPHPYSEKNAKEFIDQCKKEDPTVTFAVEFDDCLCGVAGLVMQSDIYRLSAEIGYWIGEPFWNKGIASIAVKLLLEYGFKNLQLQRIYTGVIDYNKASQRVLEKCGFEFEGIFKKAIIKNNKIYNEHRYGINSS